MSAGYATIDDYRPTLQSLQKQAAAIQTAASALDTDAAKKAAAAAAGVYFDIQACHGYAHRTHTIAECDYVETITGCHTSRDLRLDDAACHCAVERDAPGQDQDLPRLSIKDRAIAYLMGTPGQWHTAKEVGNAIDAKPRSVTAKLAEAIRDGIPIESSQAGYIWMGATNP